MTDHDLDRLAKVAYDASMTKYWLATGVPVVSYEYSPERAKEGWRAAVAAVLEATLAAAQAACDAALREAGAVLVEGEGHG